MTLDTILELFPETDGWVLNSARVDGGHLIVVSWTNIVGAVAQIAIADEGNALMVGLGFGGESGLFFGDGADLQVQTAQNTPEVVLSTITAFREMSIEAEGNLVNAAYAAQAKQTTTTTPSENE